MAREARETKRNVSASPGETKGHAAKEKNAHMPTLTTKRTKQRRRKQPRKRTFLVLGMLKVIANGEMLADLVMTQMLLLLPRVRKRSEAARRNKVAPLLLLCSHR